MKYVILITGASSGFGALTARCLAEGGHTVYATMRETGGRNAKQVEAARKFAAEKNVDLRTAELDVSSQESADRAVQQVLGAAGRLDIIIHNAGHMVFGPAEAFTPEQLAEIYDANVLSTQRVKIVVPGAFMSGTNHFANAGKPSDASRLNEYLSGPTAKLGEEIMQGFARTAVPDADVAEVADAIVKVVDMPFGQRPFRVHVDPANDGAEVVNGVADRVRAELLRNMGLGDLLRPSSTPNNFQIKVGRTADAPRVLETSIK